jgi:hypothetical protein
MTAVGVPHLVGGSVASTIHGEPRATLDVDFATHLEAGYVEPLVELLDGDFFLDRPGILAAIQHHSSFNLIHRTTMMKVDVFVRPRSGHFGEEMSRAVLVQTVALPKATLRVATPEDTILQKLRWYALTDETSDRPWRDVLGVVRTCEAELDVTDLGRWARVLGVGPLLERALGEGRQPPRAG